MITDSESSVDYIIQTFRLESRATTELATCADWRPNLRAFPRANAAWALRGEPDLISTLFGKRVWDELTRAQRATLVLRASARTWSRLPGDPGSTSMLPANRRLMWELAVLVVVEELLRVQVPGPLPAAIQNSPLFTAYAVMRRRGSTLLAFAIDLLCRADVHMSSRGEGLVVIGPSTTVPGTWGAIALGTVRAVDYPMEGMLRHTGAWQEVRRPNIRSADHRVWDGSTVLTIPAVVVSAETAGRSANVRLWRGEPNVWVGTSGELTSTELFLSAPPGVVTPPLSVS